MASGLEIVWWVFCDRLLGLGLSSAGRLLPPLFGPGGELPGGAVWFRQRLGCRRADPVSAVVSGLGG